MPKEAKLYKNFPFLQMEVMLKDLSNQEIIEHSYKAKTIFELLSHFETLVNNLQKEQRIDFVNHFLQADAFSRKQFADTALVFLKKIKKGTLTELDIKSLPTKLMQWRLEQDHYQYFNQWSKSSWQKLFRPQATDEEIQQILIEKAAAYGFDTVAQTQGLYSKSFISRAKVHFAKPESQRAILHMSLLLTATTLLKFPAMLPKRNLVEETKIAKILIENFFNGKSSIDEINAIVNNNERRYVLVRATFQALIFSTSAYLVIETISKNAKEGINNSGEEIDGIKEDKIILQQDESETPEEIKNELDSLPYIILRNWAKKERPGVSQDSLEHDPDYLILKKSVFGQSRK